MTFPRMDSVWALYALQKSMMLTPCGPRAVPTGGAGVAAPAWSCTLTSAAIFFLGGIALLLPHVVMTNVRTTPCHFFCCPGPAGGGAFQPIVALVSRHLASSVSGPQ